MNEVINILNIEVVGYYLFGGMDVVNDLVVVVDIILNGLGSLFGLKIYMSEFL